MMFPLMIKHYSFYFKYCYEETRAVAAFLKVVRRKQDRVPKAREGESTRWGFPFRGSPLTKFIGASKRVLYASVFEFCFFFFFDKKRPVFKYNMKHKLMRA